MPYKLHEHCLTSQQCLCKRHSDVDMEWHGDAAESAAVLPEGSCEDINSSNYNFGNLVSKSFDDSLLQNQMSCHLANNIESRRLGVS